MSAEPRLWLFNLDAELELAFGAGYSPARKVLARIDEEVARIRPTLPLADRVFDGGAAPGMDGRAWCPTPSALRRLAEAGAIVPSAPSLEVLRAANDRALSFALSPLPGARVLDAPASLDEALAALGRVRVKRAFTFAGRGHRRIDRATVDARDRAFVASSLPAYAEPRVEIELELSLHGWIAPDGLMERGRALVQTVDETGQWRASRLARDEPSDEERRRLHDALDQARAALVDLGYFGPFGVDAFRYRHGRRRGFQPLSEINARYSRGWALGMGGWR